MIKRHHTKSCCGKKAYIFESSKPITQTHIQPFKKAGWASPDHYRKVGVFYIEHKGVSATGPFGSTRLQVKCSAGSGLCRQLLDSLANTIERIVVHGQ
jgi:hypothetical protein